MKEKIKQKFEKLAAAVRGFKKKIGGFKSANTIKIAIVASVFLALVLIPTHQAHALFGISDIAGWAVGAVSYVISTLLGMIFGIFILVEAWLIGVVLQINANVINTAIVQSGFSVTLALANLGFVLGIIVIAIATILRRETYGIKQILWKLVTAAILVNFSLVIAGPIIGFSNSITNQFMKAFPGQGGGYWTFANNMASVFQPQQFLTTGQQCSGTDVAAAANCTANSTGAINKLASGVGKTIGTMIGPLFSVVGALIGLLLIVIVLFVFFLTLLIRYVYLAMLLILMPLAWVAWVFPKFSHQWSKWWSKFFQWTFYPPIVVFFIWLVIQTGAAIRAKTSLSPFSGSVAGFSSTASNPAASAISNLFGGILTPVISTALNTFLLCGLIVGGMIAAQSLSITGAGMAVNAAKSVKNGIQGFAGRQGKKLGRMALQRTGITERLEKGRLGALGRIPGARRLAGIGGRELRKAEVAGGADLVEKEARNVPDDKDIFMSQLAGSMKKELQLAFLRKAADRNWTNDIKTINGKPANMKDFLTENQQNLTNYHQGKLKTDLNVASGGNQEMRDAEKEMNVARTPDEIETAAKKLDKAADAFVAGLSKSDAAKMDVNGLFSPAAPQRWAEALQKGIAKNNPAIVQGLLNNMKGSTQRNFKETYKPSIDKAKNEAAADNSLSTEDKEKIFGNLEFATTAFERAIENNAFGFAPAAAGGGAQPQPTPPPAAGGGTK